MPSPSRPDFRRRRLLRYGALPLLGGGLSGMILRDVEIFQEGTKDKWEQPG